jgi:rhodanese-related sulfurtransferase
VLTGDTLFIGDVGRPDLLAAVGFTADELAHQLYHSLHDTLLALPDATRVFPAHGAGSACGKNLSTETVSTIGEQRRTNYALAPMSEDAFVEVVTQGQAAAPLYFLFAATKNRQDREMLDEAAEVASLSIDAVFAAQAAGAAVVDTRDAADFAAAHLRGSFNVGLGGRFAEYTGEVVRPGTPIVVVADPGYEHEAVIRLARIGFDTVIGALDEPLAAFLDRPDLVAQASRLTATEFDARRREVPHLQVVDVRGPSEVEHGIIDSAVTIQLPQLVDRLGELDPAVPTVVYCAGGYRSSIAASTLRAHGFTDVSDILGGYGAWAGRDTA